jgi:hypothetical protein
MVLELYGEYDRRGIHNLFSPDTAFEPSRGTWGSRALFPCPTVLAITFF